RIGRGFHGTTRQALADAIAGVWDLDISGCHLRHPQLSVLLLGHPGRSGPPANKARHLLVGIASPQSSGSLYLGPVRALYFLAGKAVPFSIAALETELGGPRARVS